MICNRVFTRREYYFSITMDRARDCPVLIGSSRGGVNIEEVAKEDPDAIKTVPVDIGLGLTRDQAREMAVSMGFQDAGVEQATEAFLKLYKVSMA